MRNFARQPEYLSDGIRLQYRREAAVEREVPGVSQQLVADGEAVLR
jgi:hypothetical protein